jgi:hypothetical protein
MTNSSIILATSRRLRAIHLRNAPVRGKTQSEPRAISAVGANLLAKAAMIRALRPPGVASASWPIAG